VSALLTRLREPWTDRKATVLLGTVASAVLVIIALMILFVLGKAWPSLHANGLSILGGGRDVDADMGKMIATGQHPPASAYTLRAWPLIYATLLISFFAVWIGLVLSLFAAVFIVEFAPRRLAGKIIPMWGWRALFLTAGIALIVALYVYVCVPESEAWQKQRDARLKGEVAVADSFGWPSILDLAEGARGADPYGLRAEFVQLVRAAETAKSENE